MHDVVVVSLDEEYLGYADWSEREGMVKVVGDVGGGVYNRLRGAASYVGSLTQFGNDDF